MLDLIDEFDSFSSQKNCRQIKTTVPIAIRRGYIEGQNLVTEYLNPEKQTEAVPGVIREPLCWKMDNIAAPYESTVKAASTVVLICINADLSARFNRKT